MTRTASIRTNLLSVLLVAFACGCSGGGGGLPGGGGGTGATGTMTVGLTDAPAERVSVFDVGLVSVAFERAGGAGVVVQPLATRIDLAQLANLTDIVGAFTLPAGVYTRAIFVFDFAAPSVCQLVSATAPAALWNPDGSALDGRKEVWVSFDTGNRLIVEPGLEKLVQFDFNLNASLQIDEPTNNVTVSTVLAADVELRAPKPNRFPGILAAVDVAGSTIQVDLKPRDAAETKGRLTLKTGSTTVFIIHGVPHDAASGLPALAGEIGARVLITTVFDPLTRQHSVTQVVAAREDVVNGLSTMEGFVCRRNTDLLGGVVSLELRGVGVRIPIYPTSTLPPFLTVPTATVTIPVSPTAIPVVVDFSTHPGTADDLDVGDRVTVLGTTYDPTGRQLEGAQLVQKRRSDVLGTVQSAANFPEVALTPLRIGPFPVTDFDPVDAGSGVASWSTTSLVVQFPPGPTPSTTDPIRAVGLFIGVGDAPPDFRAITIVNRDNAMGGFFGRWQRPLAPPATFPVGATTPAQIGIDVGSGVDVGCIAAVYEDGLIAANDRKSGQPSRIYALVPALPTGLGVYTLKDEGGMRVFRSFGAFAQTVAERTIQGRFRGVMIGGLGKERQPGTFAAAEIHVDLLP